MNPVQRAKNQGFTLVEVLIAIAVIVILVTVIVLGMGALTNSTRRNQTNVMLERLKNIQAEFAASLRSSGKTRPQPGFLYSGNRPGNYSTGNNREPALNTDGWRDANVLTPAADPLPAPGSVAEDGFGASGNYDRLASDAVINTQRIMGLLVQPKNAREMAEQVQQDQRLRSRTTPFAPFLSFRDKSNPIPDGSPADPPVFLDGWGNPIIYVPGAGLGIDPSLPPGTYGMLTVGGQQKIITAPDGQGFWASAGPDGSFSKGDDNLYSFEN